MKNFLKINRALVAKKKITFLFALLCASVMGWAVDQDTWIGSEDPSYNNQFKWYAISDVTIPTEVVNIQKPGWSEEIGIYTNRSGYNKVTFNGVEKTNGTHYHQEGAGVVLFISALTEKNTDVLFYDGANVVWGLRVYNEKGSSSTSCTDETAPTVSTVSVGSITYNSAVLTITASDNAGGSGISSYIVKNGDTQIASSSSNEITLTGLTPNTTYDNIKVFAKDGCDNLSSAYAVESFKTANIIYNQFPTGHLSAPNFGDIYGRILLTIKKVDDATIAVKVEPNNNGTKGIKYLNIVVNGVGHEYGNNDGSGDDLTGFFEIGGLASLDFTFDLWFYCNTPNWTTHQFSVTESQLYVEAPSDTEKPSMAEASVSKVSQTHNSVVISITGASDNVGVTKYVVKNHSDNSSVGEYTPAENQITVSDLSPATAYNWDIYAKDAAGNVSDNCKNITFTTDALVSNYCGVTLTEGTASVEMSCEFKNNKYIISFTNPTVGGEASTLAGFNGSFCTINGTGAHDVRNYYSVNNSEKIELEFDGVPNFYTGLYINIPANNQRTFSWPNDVVWGTCPAVAVTGVTLNENVLNMQVGGATQTLVATVTPSNASNKAVSWSSNHPEIASVENGVITANAEGQAIITVTTEDGSYTDQCTVNVTVPSITPVTYNGYCSDGNFFVKYAITRTSNKDLAISADIEWLPTYSGVVAQIWRDGDHINLAQSGSTFTGTFLSDLTDGDVLNLYFRFEYALGATGLEAFNYTVGSEQAVPASIPVGAVVLNKASNTLSVGETDNLTATVYPSFATSAGSITWASSAPAYASVDAGTVTAVAAGTANITATCGGVTSDPCEITVVASLAETKFNGCGTFVNNAGKAVAYDYTFTRATNHQVTLDVVFSRSMNGIIGENNFQMYINGANQHLTYDDSNRTASYSFGEKADGNSINYYFYFVLDGGGLHQTSQATYNVGDYNEAVHAFAIGENESNEAALVAADGQNFAEVIVARSFAADNLYTLVLPFSADAEQTAAKLPGSLTKLNNTIIKDNEDLRVNFVNADAIEAGVPYLYTPSADVVNPVFADVTIDKDLNPSVPADGYASYHGIYAPLDGDDIHALSNAYVLGSDQYLYSVANLPAEQTMKALRGYFVLNFPVGSSQASARVVFNTNEVETATGMESIQSSAISVQKVLENGQVLIIRGGRTYNAQGQMIK